MPALDLDNASFDQAIKQLFDSAHASYTLQPGDSALAGFTKGQAGGLESSLHQEQ
jgi:hypothetical protein